MARISRFFSRFSSTCRNPPKIAENPCPPVRKSCPPEEPFCPSDEIYDSGLKFWKNASLFVAIPSLILTSIVVYFRHRVENCLPRPEYKAYSYMYIMRKPFFWGDGKHPFFFNPEKNPIPPDGYEVPDPNAEKEPQP